MRMDVHACTRVRCGSASMASMSKTIVLPLLFYLTDHIVSYLLDIHQTAHRRANTVTASFDLVIFSNESLNALVLKNSK